MLCAVDQTTPWYFCVALWYLVIPFQAFLHFWSASTAPMHRCVVSMCRHSIHAVTGRCPGPILDRGRIDCSCPVHKATLHADSKEAYVYFVGPKGSGKSSLIGACVHTPPNASRRTSDVVDFLWVQRANALGRHDSACIWELPGTDALAQAMVTRHKV